MKSSQAYTNVTAGLIGPKQSGRFDIAQYGVGAQTLENFVVEYYGGAARTPGTRYVAETKDSTKDSVLIPFVFSTVQAYTIEAGDQYMRFFKDGGQILSGAVPYELPTNFLESELRDIGYTQDADKLYIVAEDHEPSELTRSAHDSWTLTDIDFVGGPLITRNTTITKTLQADSATGTATITADGHTPFLVGHIGSIWRLNDGYFKITAFTDTTHVTGVVQGEDNLGSTSAEWDWAEAAFSDVRGYPSATTFYEERLVFGKHPAFPQSVWMSKPGIFNDFTIGAADTDGIFFEIKAKQVNAIKWFDSGTFLTVGTSSGLFRITLDGVLASVSLLETTGVGGNESVRIGGLMHFVERDTRTVAELVFDYNSDSYQAVDITNLAKVVTETGIVDFSYQKSPNSILWGIRTDGDLCSLTRIVPDKIKSWHTQTTSGLYKAIATIPNGEEDQTWFIVEREINGNTVRYIEYLESFDFGEDQEDAFFVHCGLTYDSTAATSISGLDHLEGAEVSILADGAPVPNQTVVSGAITLAKAASVVQVGLPYTSTIKTMRLEQGSVTGASHGKLARIYGVTLNVYKSLGGSYKTDEDSGFYEMIWRRGDDVGGVATELQTDSIKDLDLTGAVSKDVYIEIKQDQPLPMTIIGIYPRMDTNDG